MKNNIINFVFYKYKNKFYYIINIIKFEDLNYLNI